jgi:hypothetical protein
MIRLAKHHIDSYVKFCGDASPPTITISADCWDPHYVEAAQLYCNMRGYPPPHYNKEEGWIIKEITPARQAAFNRLYQERFAHLSEVVAEHKHAPSESKALPQEEKSREPDPSPSQAPGLKL